MKVAFFGFYKQLSDLIAHQNQKRPIIYTMSLSIHRGGRIACGDPDIGGRLNYKTHVLRTCSFLVLI